MCEIYVHPNTFITKYDLNLEKYFAINYLPTYDNNPNILHSTFFAIFYNYVLVTLSVYWQTFNSMGTILDKTGVINHTISIFPTYLHLHLWIGGTLWAQTLYIGSTVAVCQTIPYTLMTNTLYIGSTVPVNMWNIYIKTYMCLLTEVQTLNSFWFILQFPKVRRW